jgi:DNA polymerase-1
MPGGLEWQWSRAPGLYEAIGWQVVSTPDLEADDLLGTFAELETAAGGKTLILTGDRDMFQCANESVTVLLQRARQEGPDEVGPGRCVYGIARAGAGLHRAARRPSDGAGGGDRRRRLPTCCAKGRPWHVVLGAIRSRRCAGFDRQAASCAVPGRRDAADGGRGAAAGRGAR